MKKLTLLFLALLMTSIQLSAQDDLMELLEDMEEEETEYAYATFKTVRIVNGHSIEMPANGVLELTIAHRFGRINQGVYDLFGLDQANMRIGLEYGVNDWLDLGVGRSNVQKTYDGFAKLRLLRQSKGKRSFPVTVGWVSAIALSSLRNNNPDEAINFAQRVNYTHQLMIARKFSDAFSLQVTPTLVHRNLVGTTADDNDVFAVGIGGRLKVTPSLSLNAEYYYLTPGSAADNFEPSFSLGIDIETGGHVFQLMFTNSIVMTENFFIAENNGSWGNGDIHFGFNLTRVFTVKRR